MLPVNIWKILKREWFTRSLFVRFQIDSSLYHFLLQVNDSISSVFNYHVCFKVVLENPINQPMKKEEEIDRKQGID
ncbi:hypothetical protein BTW01_14605 [Bacillus sp. SKDU12]|nr:hypothetical protein BTW01_14605 [Bacillus sp. SKDU12]